MIIKFFDESKFFKKKSIYKLGDYMAMKKLFKGKDDGHLE